MTLIPHKIFAVLALGLILFVSISGFTNDIGQSDHSESNIKIPSTLESGDMVLRMGTSMTSEMMRNYSKTDKRFSHCGILSKNDADEWVVYHSIGGETSQGNQLRIEPLESFISPDVASQYGYFKFGITLEERLKVIEILEHWRLAGLPFDRDFDLRTDDKMYCSEVIYKGLNQATGQQIIRPAKIGEKEFITIESLFLNPKCTEIASYAN